MAESKDSFLRDMVREVLGEWIGFRYFQRGSAAQPGTSAASAGRRGSLLAAIYKANLTPAKRQQALDFNTDLEQKNPSGKSRLEEVVDNDGLAKMLETGTPAEWLQSIPRSGVQHLQTTFFGDDESRARRKPPWWRTGLRRLCVVLIIVVVGWFCLFVLQP